MITKNSFMKAIVSKGCEIVERTSIPGNIGIALPDGRIVIAISTRKKMDLNVNGLILSSIDNELAEELLDLSVKYTKTPINER